MSVEGQSVEGLVHVPLGNGQVPGYRNQHGRLQGTVKTTTIALCNVLDHQHAVSGGGNREFGKYGEEGRSGSAKEKLQVFVHTCMWVYMHMSAKMGQKRHTCM